MEFVSWDDDIPNIWKIIKFMFQTTNQIIIHVPFFSQYVGWFNHQPDKVNDVLCDSTNPRRLRRTPGQSRPFCCPRRERPGKLPSFWGVEGQFRKDGFATWQNFGTLANKYQHVSEYMSFWYFLWLCVREKIKKHNKSKGLECHFFFGCIPNVKTHPG